MLKLAENLTPPLDFVTERIAFLARTGAGKSGGMRVEFEQFVDAGIFSIFVDPKGDAWGIRGAGKGPGKQVLIIGGDHADIPIEPTAGKVIAEFLMRERVSCVIDISDFGTTEMWRFMADFTKTAYKINREVCHLFIDEVDMLAGQQYFDPHCLHGIQLIQNKGRNRGWGVTIASQRPQMVNLTVLNASGTYIVMQTVGDDGLKVVRRLLGAVCSKEVTAAVVAQLPTLKTREAFVYSPQLLGIDPVKITFNEFQTFDSMRTPKPGETIQKPKSLADINLDIVKRDMAATIEKVKAEDPKKLQAEIARLNRELAKKPTAEVQTKEIEIPVFPIGARIELEALAKDIDLTVGIVENKVLGALNAQRTQLLAIIEKYKTEPAKAMAVVAGASRSNILPTPVKSSPSPKSQPAMKLQSAVINGDFRPNRYQQDLLNGLAELEVLNIDAPTRRQLGFVTAKSARSSHFGNMISALRTAGMIEYPGDGNVALTDIGRAVARAEDAPSDLSELHARVRRLLNSYQTRIFDALIEVFPDALSRDDLAGRIGASADSSHFGNMISALKTAEIITYPQQGWLRADDLLFPEGLS